MRVYFSRRSGRIVYLHESHRHRCFRCERKRACRHLIHHYAEGVKVASRVYLTARDLLGTDIVHRSDSLVGHCNRLRVRELCYAEIHDLYYAVFQKHDVLRLYVTVDYSLFVSMVECAEYLCRVADYLT